MSTFKAMWANGLSATFMLRFHLVATIAFLVLIPPSMLLWKNSVPYLVGISVWANFAGHLSAWQAARVEARVDAAEANGAQAGRDRSQAKGTVMSLLWTQAMAWNDLAHQQPGSGRVIHARDVGFAGYVKPTDERDDEPYDHEDEPLGVFVNEHSYDSDMWRRHGTRGGVDLRRPVFATQSHLHTGHLDRYDEHPGTQSWHAQHGGESLDYLGEKDPLFATHQGRLHVVDGHHRVGAALRRGDVSIDGWHIDLDKSGHEHLTDYPEGGQW